MMFTSKLLIQLRKSVLPSLLVLASFNVSGQMCSAYQVFSPDPFCQAGGSACWFQFNPSGAWNCVVTGTSTMGATCDIQPAAMGTWRLRAFNMTPSPTFAPLSLQYCQFQCDCGDGDEIIRIDSSNGLPVELLEFSIDDEVKGVSE